MKKWRCTVCGHIHAGDFPPAKCPVCGSSAEKFVLITSGSDLSDEKLVNDDKNTASTDTGINTGNIVKDGDKIKWDKQGDIVVLGGGGAGLSAACSASEKGASVLLLEKAENVGGDTQLSGQIVIGLWPKKTKEISGSEDSLELYMSDWKTSHKWCAKGQKGEPLADDFPFSTRHLIKTQEMYEWMESTVGITWTGPERINEGVYPQPQWNQIQPRTFPPTSNLIPQMEEAAQKLNVTVMKETEAIKLITNSDNRVIGVQALDIDGKSILIKASKAVIVATGSFCSNRGMMAKYMPSPEGLCYPGGCKTANGDGHRMVQQIGGGLRDMSLGAHWLDLDSGTDAWVFQMSMDYYGGPDGRVPKSDMPGILINFDGKRYMAESMGYKYIGKYTAEQINHEGYYVFDSTDDVADLILTKGVLGDVRKNALIISGNTIEELSHGMLVDAEILKAEVARYNDFVENGTDADFGKRLVGCKPLATAPFYAIRLRPKHYATYGGIATDIDSHALTRNGEIIPGLYAAGICTGSYAEQEGLYYLGGVSQSLTFGRQAGLNALNEPPWE